MPETLTLEELSRLTGEPSDHLTDWQSRGLIGVRGDGYSREDIERVRLVQLCLRRGIKLSDIVEAAGRYALMDRYVQLVSPETPSSRYSAAEAAEIIGLDAATVNRFWQATGYPDYQGELLDDDIEALRILKGLRDAGFPEDAIVEGARVYADSMSRVAEMEAKLFHFYIHKRLEATGLSGDALMEAVDRAGDLAQPLTEPAMLYFHRKAWQRAIREDWVMHVAEEAGLLKPGDVPGQLQAAVVFIDLSSFTPLAEAMGDAAAAEVLERFSRIVRSSVVDFGGRIVKQIGDAFMLIFQDARSAVACATEIEGEVAKEPQFPAARAGIQWGDILYREGDYVGSNVNIAARLATEAERHQVLVTADVRQEAAGIPGIEFVRLGKRTLKGLGGKFELFTAQAAGSEASGKRVDPVCGMELQESEVAARLTIEGEERAFCSEDCLRKFVAAPERYG